MTDQIRIKAFMSLMEPEINNWLRYSRDKSHYPPSWRCVLGQLRAPRDRNDDAPPEVRQPPVNELEAVRFDEVVRSLDKRKRIAFLLYLIGEAGADNKKYYANTREDGAIALGISGRRYNQIVRDAAEIVYRRFYE